jgi:hypothetical protein
MSSPGEQSEVIRAAVAVLDEMAIAYAIGGSIASSTYGAYFERSAVNLGVADLLQRASKEAMP